MQQEVRKHLGPGEIEIDSPLYGILLVGNGSALMTGRVYDSRGKAMESLGRFEKTDAYVVRIGSTNLDDA